MNVRRRVLDYSLAGLLLLLPALILHANIKDPSNLNKLDQAVLRVSSPLQLAVSWVVEGIGGVFNRYVWLVDVEAENRELRKENARLARELSELKRKTIDYELVRRLAALRTDPKRQGDVVSARVVAATLNPYFRVGRMRVDAGDAKLQQGMAVIDAYNRLVGRISRVYGSYADILLAIDPQSKISVFVPRTGGRGVLSGLGKHDSYACKIAYVARGEGKQDKTLRVGDRVVTSGLGAFPAGIEVGKIVHVDDVEYGLFQKVKVEPSVDFSNLRAVVVLLSEPPPADPNRNKKKVSARAYGVTPY